MSAILSARRAVLRALPLALVLALAVPLPLAAPVAAHDDLGAIRHVLMATFDRPEAPLVVDPVAVAGGWAVAGWTQEDRGGRALLRRKDQGWSIHLCAGDALKDAAALAAMGLPTDVAATLAADLATAEAKVDPAQVALFATFDGIVEMNADGSHPDHGHGAGHGAHGAHGG